MHAENEYIVWEDDGDHIGKTMVMLWGQCRDNIGIKCDMVTDRIMEKNKTFNLDRRRLRPIFP